jgi:hypothetical protein
MTNNLKINELPGNILYIENAFPLHKEFIDAIEKNNDNEELHSIIPAWTKWVDGYPVRTSTDAEWEQVFPDNDYHYRGVAKLLDWDISINDSNNLWPKAEVGPLHSETHKKAYEIIKMIDKPYLDMLDIWYDKFNQPKLEYVSKNYCIRKYRTGGAMGPHVDRNVENPKTSMDWTALIYLNDNYEGGEVVFPDLELSIKPAAGSILFFPCEAVHEVEEITEGNKYYIFTFIHTKYSMATNLGEQYLAMTDKINDINGWTY